MKKSLSSLLALSLIISNFSPVLSVSANELQSNEVIQEGENEENQVKEVTVRPFTLSNYDCFDAYNEQYRVSKDEIVSFSNNGGAI